MKKVSILQKPFRLFERSNGVFYSESTATGKQRSLGVSDRPAAEHTIAEMNRAGEQGRALRSVLMASLRVCDPQMANRTWESVLEAYSGTGKPQTQERKRREFKHPRYNRIRSKTLMDTVAEDFQAIMEKSGQATSHFLKRLQNYALDMNWLASSVIPTRLWPKFEPKPKRSITHAEHILVIEAEKNEERRNFYELAWHIGASQSDAASLTDANVDWHKKVLTFRRSKTGELARIGIAGNLETLLMKLPQRGPLFPNIAKTSANDRAAEFYRRCGVIGVKGVSLHSYRYAWAERAFAAGIPERMAQSVLGHSSALVHRHYAKNAEVVCKPLE